MPSFGERSLKQRSTLSTALQAVLDDAIKYYDFSIVCGHRGEEDQNRANDEGKSQLRWPNSKHNRLPSRAVDIIPYPTGYDNIEEFYKMATYIFKSANKLGYKINWGGHWRTLKDYPHFEEDVNYDG